MVEFYYLVKMKKKTAKSPNKYFVCVKNRRDELSIPNIFHGVGYWAQLGVNEKFDSIFEDAENKDEKEVWIPYNSIEYVESLMYRPR